MTGTHKDEGLGIIGWKVILVEVNRGIIHRCDNVHYSLHRNCKNASNIRYKWLSLWCLKEGEQCFWEVNWMCDWRSIAWEKNLLALTAIMK